METKVLLISKKSADEQLISKKLFSQGQMVTTTANSAEHAVKLIQHESYDLVIFNLEKFTPDKLVIAKNLREMGHRFPVMAVASIVDINTLLSLDSLPGTVLLEKPFADKDLVGIAQKLIRGDKVNQRIYRRFATNQIANLEVLPTGASYPTHIFNLSKGGAFLEAPDDIQFRQGDIVKLDIRLRQINRKHGVHAKVVWTHGKASWNKGQSVGVEFLSTENIYQHMLSSL